LLGRESLHVSDAVQDFTSEIYTQGVGEGHALTVIQNNASSITNDDVPNRASRAQVETDFHNIVASSVPRYENEGTVPDDVHDVVELGKHQRRERIEKAVYQRTEDEQDIRDRNANDRGVNDQVNETGREAKQPGIQEARQTHYEPQADRAIQGHFAIGEILRQQDKVLQISQNGIVNQMEAQAVMVQLSARIDQIIVEQRQLHGNWRRLRMEDQNRTQQNMGDY
jgi:hypothetical protein